jgi:hypothetical protein
MTFLEHLANLVLGNAESSSLPRAATSALEEGYDSPHLRILAGEDEEHCNSFEADDLLRKALKELNMSLPSHDEAARILICCWARKIIAGTVSPEDGSMRIVREVYNRLEHREEVVVGESLGMANLIGCAYNYDDLQEGSIEYEGKAISKAKAIILLNGFVIEEARKYLSSHCA